MYPVSSPCKSREDHNVLEVVVTDHWHRGHGMLGPMYQIERVLPLSQRPSRTVEEPSAFITTTSYLPVLTRKSYINLSYEAEFLRLDLQAVVCSGVVSHDFLISASSLLGTVCLPILDARSLIIGIQQPSMSSPDWVGI
jgi:hypothetical protein